LIFTSFLSDRIERIALAETAASKVSVALHSYRVGLALVAQFKITATFLDIAAYLQAIGATVHLGYIRFAVLQMPPQGRCNPRREARRPAGGATQHFRARHQSQNREGARAGNSADSHCHRR
jgi:hypothetical protein